MFLAIDVGNTKVCIGCFSGDRLRHFWKLSTFPIRTADEIRAELHGLFGLEGISLRDVTAAAISSVVPEAVGPLRSAFSSVEVTLIDSSWNFSFRNATREPSRVGTDRLVNLEAALRECGSGKPIFVVDAGTATTISVLEASGDFVGGAILPGLTLMNESLASRAAQLFSVELCAPERAIGRDTNEALQSGVVLGYIEMVNGLLERMLREAASGKPGGLPAMVVTGGNAELLVRWAPRFAGARLEPLLTLRGIRYLYETKFHS